MVSATPVTDPTKLPLVATVTKSPFQLDLGGLTPGATMYVAAQWAVQTGGLSPYSGIISCTVPSLG
jgi:hypothetical protein